MLLDRLWNFLFILNIIVVLAIVSRTGLSVLMAFTKVTLGNRDLSRAIIETEGTYES
jgi:hypothetical protein